MNISLLDLLKNADADPDSVMIKTARNGLSGLSDVI
jgi:hypothetical protein